MAASYRLNWEWVEALQGMEPDASEFEGTAAWEVDSPSMHLPSWYFVVGLLWSCYQGFRGAIEQDVNGRISGYTGNLSTWERWVVLYVHDFGYRFVCTAAGFVALWSAHDVWAKASLKDPSALAFTGLAFLVGVVGVGGQLHYVILLGKWPK